MVTASEIREAADPAAAFGCQVVLSALTTGVVVLMGLPAAYASVVGGAILFRDKLPEAIGKFAGAFKSGPPPA